ncbi:MAG: GNAT family N-acetyltransferase [Proteobacteria bacterium]|nr:GNAT family N-acetyltransferase [Pseudomonadota bacterium]
MELNWQWYTFEDLSSEDLYAILTLRQQVFVVEQQCAYLDCDGLDQGALHLVGWQKIERHSNPLAYLRVILPKKEGEMPVIGRLLTHPEIRGKGAGETLLVLGLQRIQTIYTESSIRISAQHYLLDFYQRFGFAPVSDIYEEDGIPHISMILSPRGRCQK